MDSSVLQVNTLLIISLYRYSASLDEIAVKNLWFGVIQDRISEDIKELSEELNNNNSMYSSVLQVNTLLIVSPYRCPPAWTRLQ